MPDPRLCCAAGICCDPPGARTATIELLREFGVTEKGAAERVADEMIARKIVLFDGAVAEDLQKMILDGSQRKK